MKWPDRIFNNRFTALLAEYAWAQYAFVAVLAAGGGLLLNLLFRAMGWL